jgi:nuclear pore complex protein Nup160
MAARSSLAGIEVPIIGSDSVKWINISLSSSTSTPHRQNFAPPTHDAASCSILGNPPTYLIWRIHESHPRVLEILELCGYKEFPRTGIRIEFGEALSPFAFICKNEADRVGNPYLLYTLTVSGIAYLVKLKSITSYTSSYVIPPNEIIEFDIQTYPHFGAITSVAAKKGILVIGARDGSVGCFQLGMLDSTSPGFLHELRDDVGLNRLWNLVSRNKNLSAVQDLVILELNEKKLLFALHTDGYFRVWDLLSHNKVFGQAINVPTSAEAQFLRLWVGEADIETRIIPVAIQCRQTMEESAEMICIYNFRYSLGDKIVLSPEPSVQNISLEEGRLIDVKLTSNKIWVLKEDGLIVQDLLSPDGNGGSGIVHCYSLQESYVADQLFQNSEHSSDNLLWLSHSIFSSKDEIAPIISSIFLRRLLLPGVHNNPVLRATLQDYNKHLSDSEFYSLSVDGLKTEILSLIEQEGISVSAVSVLYCWKIFCSRYFENWCKHSAPCGLLIDSSAGSIGLIRKGSVSLFRCLEDIEHLIFGSFEELDDVINPTLEFSDDLERELLFDILRCINNVNNQLGKSSSAVYSESLLCTPAISIEESVPRFVKILESGYSSAISALHLSELGADTAWQKEMADHKNLRKFSADMFISLHALCNKATNWAKVLDVVQSYLKFLVPQKTVQKLDNEAVFSINSCVTVQATAQVAKMMFESALDVLLLLSYMINISGQINLSPADVSRIQLELIPMIQEVITEWHIINYFGTTPSESPSIEDFSSQLSSLQIDSSTNKTSWNEKLGRCDFTLSYILALNFQSFSEKDQSAPSFRRIPDPDSFISSVREFTSWIIWGKTGEESSSFFSHLTDLSVILLRHGQCDAVEYLLSMVDVHLRKEKTSESVQSLDGEWCKLLHLLGCCLLAQAHRGLHGLLKDKKISEAIRCLFRAASGQGAPQALQSLSHEARLPHLNFSGGVSAAAWKLHYYECAMQLFEQYNMCEGACQFALAALEQVDEALISSTEQDPLSESPTTIKGRLWANVFKFTLDLNYFYDAYCAIISNPDEESKSICLRRFIFVLYERGAIKILCDGRLPFTGLADKVEQELAWKAERSDISAKPNSYKLLYAFEMNRHNWRKAANYIYQYSAQLKIESASKDHQRRSQILQDRLNGISAAINALHLVHPAYAWIDFVHEQNSPLKESYPSKKARITAQEQPEENGETKNLSTFVDIEKLENEYVLASAEYFLSLENVKWSFTGNEKPPSEVVDLLVHSNLYDMAFTVLLRFWKGSSLKRELERVFVAISMNCCPSRVGTQGFLLTSSKDEMVVHGSHDISPSPQPSKANSKWETLELYLEKYKVIHPRLPIIVAETLLDSDSQIELPLWLVHMFKGAKKESSWGMAGSESNPAALLRLYVDFGRYTEATNLLLEYIESFASVRPAEIIRRKRASAVWFPYTTIERLWCKLEESIRLGRMVIQCEKLKNLLRESLLNHLNSLKVDSDDVMSSAAT